jgi:hypothetical protein
LGELEIGDGTAPHTFYVDDRNYFLGNGVWIYEESNGIFTPHPYSPHVYGWWDFIYPRNGDLQRGGAGILDPYVPGGDKEVCSDRGPWQPDTLID